MSMPPKWATACSTARGPGPRNGCRPPAAGPSLPPLRFRRRQCGWFPAAWDGLLRLGGNHDVGAIARRAQRDRQPNAATGPEMNRVLPESWIVAIVPFFTVLLRSSYAIMLAGSVLPKTYLDATSFTGRVRVSCRAHPKLCSEPRGLISRLTDHERSAYAHSMLVPRSGSLRKKDRSSFAAPVLSPTPSSESGANALPPGCSPRASGPATASPISASIIISCWKAITARPWFEPSRCR